MDRFEVLEEIFENHPATKEDRPLTYEEAKELADFMWKNHPLVSVCEDIYKEDK